MNIIIKEKKEEFSQQKFNKLLQDVIKEYNITLKIENITFLNAFYKYIQEEQATNSLSIKEVLNTLAKYIVENKLFDKNGEYFKLVKSFILYAEYKL